MSARDLLKYVLDRCEFVPPTFSGWVESSDRFRQFAEKYKDKICAKFTQVKTSPQPDEKLTDTILELELAYLALSRSEFSVKYELYGTVPDFTMTDRDGVAFNMEVKHIQKAPEEKRMEAWRSQVAQEVRAIPSALAVGINIGLDIDPLDPLLDLLARLERNKAAVIDWIADTIEAEEKNLPVDGRAKYSVPGFEGEAHFVLSKPSAKPSSDHTCFYGGITPVFRTGKEWQKFKDLIFPQQDQTIPGKINILAINSRSATHDKHDLEQETGTDFNERVARGNATEGMKRLSGILLRAAYDNLLWRNRIAICPIPDTIAQALQLLASDWHHGAFWLAENGRQPEGYQ